MSDQARVDVGAAVRAVEAALDFDWTWTADDVERFCAVAGWTPDEPVTTEGLTVTTDFAVARPVAHVNFIADTISTISVFATDTVRDGPPEAFADAFAALGGRLIDLLGAPDRGRAGAKPTLTWTRSSLVICLAGTARTVFLDFASPAYQEFFDRLEAARID